MAPFSQKHETPEIDLISGASEWLRGLDLNQRPLGYEPNELPGCSTPRSEDTRWLQAGQGHQPNNQRNTACVTYVPSSIQALFKSLVSRSSSRS
jgi:hypothetical protein